MAFRLLTKIIDITTDSEYVCLINKIDSDLYGFKAGNRLQIRFSGAKQPTIFVVNITDSIVKEGEIGLYKDCFSSFNISEKISVQVDFVTPSQAVVPIKKKLIDNETLTYDDFHIIMAEITNGKVSRPLISYFVAAGYCPGFSDVEIMDMTKALANTGDLLKFKGIVADKHSIGGVAGKGITPIVIPIVASFPNITVPNTSTKAITSSSATTDMLEVIMPMSFKKGQLEEIIQTNGSFMVWGGGLSLAPADDKIIQVEKLLGTESIDKVASSIVAKKVAQGITHVIFDIPVGRGAKIKESSFDDVKSTFEKICHNFNIKVIVRKRVINGIDGFAAGPTLECREFLRIYENHPAKSVTLMEESLKIAGELLELCEVVPIGKGYLAAKDKLENGEAYDKLKSIIKVQGGNSEIKSGDLKVGDFTYDIIAEREGRITFIDNKKLFKILKALGNPGVKEAGIYFNKVSGDMVTKGEKFATLYATSEVRISLAKESLKFNNPIEIG